MPNAAYLTLELTENVLIDGAHTVADTMRKLAKLEIHSSIDDFGTRYFGLGYRRRLPLREIEIDDSIVQDICDDANDDALVEALLSLARYLHVSAVAEGVESDARWRFLTAHGCQRMQGFLFGEPSTARHVLQR